MKKINYGGWKNCIKLSNGGAELVVTTDIGPRVIRFGFVGGQNFMKEFPSQLGKTGGRKWIPYGGHRLWHAPEADPRTYIADNVPVKYKWSGNTLTLTNDVEPETGILKEMEITLDKGRNHVTIVHRLTNRNMWDIECAAWALSVMAAGGRAIVPQEEYRPHPQYLLPARPIVVWHYTDMSDPRFIWGEKYIQLRQDPKARTKNKFGCLNTPGWAAYTLNRELFIKRFPFVPGASYVDFGCNCECFTDPAILEIESLSPLRRIPPGGAVEHTEHWYLYRVHVPEDESSIDKVLTPLIEKTNPHP